MRHRTCCKCGKRVTIWLMDGGRTGKPICVDCHSKKEIVNPKRSKMGKINKIRDFFRPSLECETCGDKYKTTWERYSFYQHQKDAYYGATFECISCKVGWFLYHNPNNERPEYPSHTLSMLDEIFLYKEQARCDFLNEGGWLPINPT